MPTDRLPVVVLCGGQGTRLRERFPDTPKALVPVGGKTVLDWLLDDLEEAGFREVALLCGHLGEQIIDHVPPARRGLAIKHSVEGEPLGTGGALGDWWGGDGRPCLVVNGDCLYGNCNWTRWRGRLQKGRSLRDHYHAAAVEMVLEWRSDCSDFGMAIFGGERGVLRRWVPGGGRGYGAANIGVFYCRPCELVALVRRHGKPCSFERDILPRLAGTANLRGCIADWRFPEGSHFHDIGTPERYDAAEDWLRKVGKL